MKPPHEMTAAELDAAVCAEIIGYGDRVIPPYREGGRPLIRDNMCNVAVRPYSTDPGAAWEVVEQMRAEHWQYYLTDYATVWDARFVRASSSHEATHKSMPRAVCEAALLAVRA